MEMRGEYSFAKIKSRKSINENKERVNWSEEEKTVFSSSYINSVDGDSYWLRSVFL